MGLRSFISDAQAAAKNLAKPERAYLEPATINMPATTGGNLYEASDLDGGYAGARRYAEIVVTNGSDDYVEIIRPDGTSRHVLAGQSVTQSFPHLATWWAIKPNSTTTAGQVIIVVKMVEL